MKKYKRGEIFMNDKDKKINDTLLDEFCPAGSAGDCTGLIPAGENLTEDEFESYKELYSFANPPAPDKKDDIKITESQKRH